MIGQLVELSTVGRGLKCCGHLIGCVGLVVDEHSEYRHSNGYSQKYWIEWIGIDPEEAYPLRRNGGIALANGTWNRRDIRLVKKNK